MAMCEKSVEDSSGRGQQRPANELEATGTTLTCVKCTAAHAADCIASWYTCSVP